MRSFLKLALAAAAFSAVPTAAFASVNIVANGGFEDPTVPPPCCNTAPPDTVTDWTVPPPGVGDVNVVLGTYNGTSGSGPNLAYQGDQYLDLVGQSGNGFISQMVNTVLGQVYTLTFAYSNNIFGGAAAASASVSIGTLNDVIFHNTATTTDLDWTIYTGTFVGTGVPMELLFQSIVDSQNGSIFLDAVSIAAVPEPGTWLMMILGFGLAGAALRRRRHRKLALA